MLIQRRFRRSRSDACVLRRKGCTLQGASELCQVLTRGFQLFLRSVNLGGDLNRGGLCAASGYPALANQHAVRGNCPQARIRIHNLACLLHIVRQRNIHQQTRHRSLYLRSQNHVIEQPVHLNVRLQTPGLATNSINDDPARGATQSLNRTRSHLTHKSLCRRTEGRGKRNVIARLRTDLHRQGTKAFKHLGCWRLRCLLIKRRNTRLQRKHRALTLTARILQLRQPGFGRLGLSASTLIRRVQRPTLRLNDLQPLGYLCRLILCGSRTRASFSERFF